MLKNLERFTQEQILIIWSAYYFAEEAHRGQFRKSGEPYIIHPVAVAQILIDHGEDYETILAALLHDTVEDTSVTLMDIAIQFGWSVANIVDGVTKMPKIPELSKKDIELATKKKFVLSFLNDIRVIKVKLADRLHNLRTLQHMRPEKQIKIAKETLEIYAPVAEKIGAFRIKNELEDLSLKYQLPEVYETVEKERNLVEERYEPILKEMLAKIKEILNNKNIPHHSKIKVRNVYGVYKHLQSDPDLTNMRDLLSIKIIVDEVFDCYTTLGVINTTYRTKYVKDYISNPKPNGYRALHSNIFMPTNEGVLVHTRIRTPEMERVAIYGLTTKMYRENPIYKTNLFQFVGSIKEEAKSNEEFWHNVKRELFEKIYVYTSSGEMKELPKGSTVIDFAYSIHPELGHKLNYAIVNGKVENPDYKLQNNDQILVVVDENRFGPNPNWMNLAITSQARNMIRKRNREVNN